MSTQKNLITLCFAAVFTLGLAACGGGGGGGGDAPVTGTTDIPPTGPPPEESAAEAAAKVVAATKAAGTKVEAIAVEAVAMVNAGLGGNAGLGPNSQPGGDDDPYSLTIKRPRSGTTIEIADTRNPDEDEDPQFAQAMDLGGGRTMHVRAMDANDEGEVVEEVVIVSTDIDAPTATKFATVMGQELGVDLAPTVDADNDGEVDNDFTALAVDEDTPAVLLLVKSDAFAAGTMAVLTFADNDTDTDDMDEAFETAGTYNGAPGTYRCNRTGGDDCTVTLDADGAIDGMSDGWIFTPDAGATSDVADADYLHYGFWLMRTTDADGATTYNEVETFAGSSIAASGGVAEVRGMASYEGGAVGVYVKNVFDSKGAIDTATSGHFKADASLMAYFGGMDVAASKANSVTGTIDNFVLQGGEENSWSVALKGDINPDNGTIVDGGTANGGGAEGSFSATFHGSVAAVDDMDDDTYDVPTPSSVVGEFDANFSNGTVAGGFGARRQ